MEAQASLQFQNLLTRQPSSCVKQNKKMVLQHDGLWFDVKMHHAESCGPFDLLANANHKLQNEAKMNVMFERGSV